MWTSHTHLDVHKTPIQRCHEGHDTYRIYFYKNAVSTHHTIDSNNGLYFNSKDWIIADIYAVCMESHAFLDDRKRQRRFGMRHFFTADILTRHSRKSTGVGYHVNDGSLLLAYPSQPWQWVCMHNTRTLKVQQLNGIQLLFISLFTLMTCQNGFCEKGMRSRAEFTIDCATLSQISNRWRSWKVN